MWYRYIVGILMIFVCYFLLYYFQTRSSFNPYQFFYRSSQQNKTFRHTAIILARQPSVKVLKHLNILVHVGVNAFVMCDEQPSKYTNVTDRLIYVNDESLARYGLTRNRVWDRVFLWLYNQSTIDYVWLMEDDVTWSNVHHMVHFFDTYANNHADLLSRNIIYKNNQTLGWMWWPKVFLDLIPEKKWSGSLNMLSRLSRRLIKAHQYYIEQLFLERKHKNLTQFDNNYYFQEFLIPTVARMSNLTMVMYDHSKLEVFFTALSEDNVRDSLKAGKQIFHAVKHDSPLLINATQLKMK